MSILNVYPMPFASQASLPDTVRSQSITLSNSLVEAAGAQIGPRKDPIPEQRHQPVANMSPVPGIRTKTALGKTKYVILHS